MKAGTLFSGIGAPECAAPWLEWRWCAEIDPFAGAVHKARFPGVLSLGDVHEIRPEAVEPVDAVVFGSPCQSFSVAGKRLGLDDPRGNLALVALRLIGRLRPRWLVFENVPGLLSSDGGRDFGAFLGLLGECGYGYAYRVLDAQHFGVPQRRRRVFVVGYLGDWRPAAAVLFEPESLRGDPAPRRAARERVAGTLESRADAGGAGWGTDWMLDGGLTVAGTIGAENVRYTTGMESGRDLLIAIRADGFDASEDGDTKPGHLIVTNGADHAGVRAGVCAGRPAVQMGRADETSSGYEAPAVVPPLVARSSRGGAQTLSPGFNTDGHIVAHSRRADGFDACEDGTGGGTPLIAVDWKNSEPQHREDVFMTLGTERTPAVAYGIRSDAARRGTPIIPIQNSQRGQDQNGLGIGGESMFTLDGASQHAIAFDPGVITNPMDHSNPQPGDPCYTLQQSMRHPPAVAFESRYARNGRGAPSDFVPPLKAQSGQSGKGDAAPLLQAGMSVRRLTPTECERLQGFPDNWTLITWRGKPAADGPRYRALGNSMAVPVVRWILRRIKECEAR